MFLGILCLIIFAAGSLLTETVTSDGAGLSRLAYRLRLIPRICPDLQSRQVRHRLVFR